MLRPRVPPVAANAAMLLAFDEGTRRPPLRRFLVSRQSYWQILMLLADIDVPHIRTKSSHKMMSKLGQKVQQYCSFFTVSRNNSCGVGHYGRPDTGPSGEWLSLIIRNFRTEIALLSQVSNVRMALDATLE
jgi:hypothetical protein